VRGKEGGRQLSIWMPEPRAASKVIKHADAGRQRRTVFLPPLQCTFHAAAAFTTPKAHVSSGDQQHCFFTGWEERIKDWRPGKKRQADFCLTLQFIPQVSEETLIWPCKVPLCSQNPHARNSSLQVSWKLLFAAPREFCQLMTCLKEQGKYPQAGNL